MSLNSNLLQTYHMAKTITKGVRECASLAYFSKIMKFDRKDHLDLVERGLFMGTDIMCCHFDPSRKNPSQH